MLEMLPNPGSLITAPEVITSGDQRDGMLKIPMHARLSVPGVASFDIIPASCLRIHMVILNYRLLRVFNDGN